MFSIIVNILLYSPYPQLSVCMCVYSLFPTRCPLSLNTPVHAAQKPEHSLILPLCRPPNREVADAVLLFILQTSLKFHHLPCQYLFFPMWSRYNLGTYVTFGCASQYSTLIWNILSIFFYHLCPREAFRIHALFRSAE